MSRQMLGICLIAVVLTGLSVTPRPVSARGPSESRPKGTERGEWKSESGKGIRDSRLAAPPFEVARVSLRRFEGLTGFQSPEAERPAESGIERELSGTPNETEIRWTVKPGANLADLRFDLPGVEGVELTSDNRLILHTTRKDIRFEEVRAWQELPNRRTVVPAMPVYKGDGRIGVAVGAYHLNEPLYVAARMFAPQATLTVTSGANSGAGTLRDQIAAAAAGDTIVFSGVTEVELTTAQLVINKNLTINGGAGVTVTRSTADGTPNFRIFAVTSGTVSFRDLTVSNGRLASDNGGGIQIDIGNVTMTNCKVVNNTALTGNGGGIECAANSSLTMTDCTVSGNTAPNGSGGGGGLSMAGTSHVLNGCTFSGNVSNRFTGGGIYHFRGTATLTNTTISGNSATGSLGGGGYYLGSGTATLTNCTVAYNTSTNPGGGLRQAGGTLNLVNTIVYGNTGPSPDIDGTVASAVNNLVGSVAGTTGITNGVNGNRVGMDPVLGSLAGNGGTTQTHALLPGSAAINAGTATGAPATDQRGISRPQQGMVDIGAFESRGFTMALSSGGNQSTSVNTNFASPLAVTVASAAGEPVNGGQVTFTPPGSGASCAIAGNPATITSGTATTGTVTANATTGGPYTVTASAAGIPSGVNFSLTNNPGTTVSSINRTSSNPACVGTSVGWTVTFAASVTGVTASNFQLVGGTGASITSVTGSGTTRTVTANTGTAAASLGLNMVNSTGVSPAPTNLPFTGQTYTVNGLPTNADAGPDQSLCVTSPTATLAANTPADGTGFWSVVSAPPGGSVTLAQFGNTGLPGTSFTPNPVVTGSFTLRWTISNSPCTASTDDVVLIYRATPTTAAAGPDQTLCLTSPAATLAANNPTNGTGAWSVVTAPGGGSTATSQFGNVAVNTTTFTPSPAVAGAYTLRWTISNPPCTASTDDVVLTYRSVTTSNAGPDQTLCVSSPGATLAANNPASGTGTWSVVSAPPGGSVTLAQFSNTGLPGATFTPNPVVTGSFTLRWTISNSPCTASTDNVVLTYRAAPTTSAAGPDQTLCLTSPAATLAANNPSSGTGAWSVAGGPSTLSTQFTNTASPTTTFTPAGGAGTYTLRWTISNSPCTASTDDVVVTVTQGPTTSNAGPDQTLCVTSPATLAANNPTVGAGAWSVVSGPSTLSTQFSNTTSPTSTFTPAGGAGTYTLRWTITNAPCPPSTDDVVLTFRATPTTATAGADQTICSSGNATLAANNPSSGTGAWSVVTGPSTSSAQFGNTASPTTTFTPAGGMGVYTLRWTISNSPCTANTDDVVVNVTQGPTTANGGPDQTVCVTGATLAANNPTVGVGDWSVVSGPSTSAAQFGNVAVNNTTFTPAGGAGTYTLRWTISNAPCPNSTDDVVVTVNAQPSTANAGPDQTLCGAAATLAANNPASGIGAWSVVTGPSTLSTQFGNVNTFNTTFTPAGGAGVYTLRWTISNPPCAASTDDVVITVNSATTTANAGADQTLCVTSPATLAANNPASGTGTWSVVTGPSTLSTQFGNVNTFNTTFTPAGGAGTYTLRWTITNAPCPPSTDDVVLTYRAAPTASNAGADQTLCSSASATLAANTPASGTGAWSIVSGPSTSNAQFSSTTSPTPTFTPAGGTGVYTLRWTISNSPCAASTDDVVLTVTQGPTTSNAGPDQTLCVTSPATLAANNPTVGTGIWSVVSGPNTSNAQFANTASPTSTFTPAGGAGVYTLRWTISNPPCPDSFDTLVLTFRAVPSTANAGADQTICLPNAATLAANNPTSGAGTWSVVSGPSLSAAQFSNVNANNALFSPAGGAGTYTLRWTISNLPCLDSLDEVVVTVQSGCSVAALLAADTQNHRIQRFDGNVWTVLVGNGVPGSAVNRCNLPKAVTSSADGQRIYVADTGNNRITYSTDGGGSWAVFAATGIGLNQVRGPQEVALDGTGNLYVADALNERVLRFAGGLPGTAVPLATSGTGPGQVKSPRGLAVDGDGNLYVTDKVLHRLLRIANAAAVAVADTGVAVVSGQGLGLSNLNGPEGVAVDNAGDIYVADTLNERVLQFPNGTAPGVVMTDGAGTTLGKVSRPEGVTVTTFTSGALAGQTFLIVSDTMNNRVEGRPLASPTWQLIGTPNNVGSTVGRFRNPSKLR